MPSQCRSIRNTSVCADPLTAPNAAKEEPEKRTTLRKRCAYRDPLLSVAVSSVLCMTAIVNSPFSFVTIQFIRPVRVPQGCPVRRDRTGLLPFDIDGRDVLAKESDLVLDHR